MKAVLVTVNWDAKELGWSFYDGADSVKRAKQLLELIKGDCPNCTHCVIVDEEAQKAMANRRPVVWLGDEYDVATDSPVAFMAVTGWDEPCVPDVDYHTFSNPIPPPGTLCQCGKTYYRRDGYAVVVDPTREEVIEVTDKDVKQVIEHMDKHHVESVVARAELAEVLAEVKADLDTKADAVDVDGFATTLGLDDVEEV